MLRPVFPRTRASLRDPTFVFAFTIDELTVGGQLSASTGLVVTANEYRAPVYDAQRYDGYIATHCPPLDPDHPDRIQFQCNGDCSAGPDACAVLSQGHTIQQFLQREADAAVSEGELSGGWKDHTRPKVSPLNMRDVPANVPH